MRHSPLCCGTDMRWIKDISWPATEPECLLITSSVWRCNKCQERRAIPEKWEKIEDNPFFMDLEKEN
jgi:hypothetical protein